MYIKRYNIIVVKKMESHLAIPSFKLSKNLPSSTNTDVTWFDEQRFSVFGPQPSKKDYRKSKNRQAASQIMLHPLLNNISKIVSDLTISVKSEACKSTRS